jgi:plasmid maintenance system antidote protein VapI
LKNYLQDWIDYLNLDQGIVANRMGVTSVTISNHATRNKKLRPSTIDKLSEALGITPDQFLAGPPQTDLKPEQDVKEEAMLGNVFYQLVRIESNLGYADLNSLLTLARHMQVEQEKVEMSKKNIS